MSLTPELAPAILSTSQAGAAEAAEAIGRTFETAVEIAVGEPTLLANAELTGGGLAVLLGFGEQGASLIFPQSTLLPDWVRTPDPTGISRLSTLAQELSMLLLPDSVFAEQFESAWQLDLSAALDAAGTTAVSSCLRYTLTAGDATHAMWLVWPLPSPAALVAVPASAPAPANMPLTASVPFVLPPAPQRPRDFHDLPPYARHLLKIEVPVMVNLVSKRYPLKDVVELVPGAIITFDKLCDEPLELCVSDRVVATGSAVKVGDRFGLQIADIMLPDERYQSVVPPRTAG